MDLVSLDSKTIRRELEYLPGFIISTHNLNIDDMDLMANSQSKRTLLNDSKGKQKEKDWLKEECRLSTKEIGQALSYVLEY